MRAGALLVVACLLVAGCAGQDGDPAEEGPDGEAVEQGPDGSSVGGPAEWSIGDHWTYRVSGEGIDEREATLVVADATDTDHVVETTDREMAYFDARPDTAEISYLGDQSRDARAGSQGGDRVRYFQWPLQDNASWTTTWDQAERTVRVLDVSDGTRAELVSRGPDGSLHARYTYDADVGWFDEISFFEDGSETFAMTLQSFGGNFSDTYVTVQPTTVLDANWTGSDGGSWDGEVAASADDFRYEIGYAADGPGDVGVGYNHLGGTEGGGDSVVQEACPCEPTTVQGTVAATPGNWTWNGGLTTTAEVQDETGYLDATIHLRDFVEHEV